MTVTVNVHQAKTHLSKLLDRAHAGEEIILAKAGSPMPCWDRFLHRVGPPARPAGSQTVGPEILLPLPRLN